MKSLAIFITCFAIPVLVFTQNYKYKKFNSLNNHYEYYDENDELMGYEEWNYLHQRWEYKSVNNYQKSYKRKPIEYPEPYNTSPNYTQIAKILKEKQRRYDIALRKLQLRVDELSHKISFTKDRNLKERRYKMYDAMVKEINSEPRDLSKNSVYVAIINFINKNEVAIFNLKSKPKKNN